MEGLQKFMFDVIKDAVSTSRRRKKRQRMNFSTIFFTLAASIFAEDNMGLIHCLEKADYDVNLSYECFQNALKTGRKSKDRD